MPTTSAPRPMRRFKREVSEPKELLSIVDRARVLRVAFADSEGLAVYPMNYGYEWHGATCTFWLHSAGEGRKAEAWATGADVAVELDVEGGVTTGDYACAYSYAYESVMAWGCVSPVTSVEEKAHGLERIMAHMAPEAPVTFSDEAVARVAIWRIDVSRLTGKRREAKGASEQNKLSSKEKTTKKKKKEAMPTLLGKIEAKLKGDPDKDELKRRQKADRKAREKAIDEVLKGQRCDGCGHTCKLMAPRCGKGKKQRDKRLAKAGLR